MNAQHPQVPGAPGPYTHPVAAAPGTQGGSAVGAGAASAPQAAVAGMGQTPAMPQQSGQSPVPPSQHQPPSHPRPAHGQHSAQVPQAQGSGSHPVREPLKTGTQVVGSGEPAEEKEGVFKGLLKIVKRDKGEPDVDETMLSKKKVGPRRVRAMLTTIDPWSVMKLAFLLSIAMGIVMFIAVGIIWNVLNQMGVFTDINSQITTIMGPENKIDFLKYTDRNKVMAATLLLAVINSVLMTGLFTIGAFLHNLIVKLVGGVYITLSDE
jgi:hypothetical protein